MTNNDLKTINRAALFSSGADEYVEPLFFMPGEEVTVRLRTAAGNVDSAGAVFVLENDVTIYRTMTVERTEGRFDYWSVSQTVPEKPLRYYFDVSAGKDRCCYLCGGFEDEPKEELFFTLVPGYRVPEWALGAVMYQIFPDRFCNGDPSNDVRTGDYLYNGEHPVRALSWEADVETEDYDSFRGGDLMSF